MEDGRGKGQGVGYRGARDINCARTLGRVQFGCKGQLGALGQGAESQHTYEMMPSAQPCLQWCDVCSPCDNLVVRLTRGGTESRVIVDQVSHSRGAGKGNRETANQLRHTKGGCWGLQSCWEGK